MHVRASTGVYLVSFVAKSGWVMELGPIHVWACLECVPVPVSELGLGLCLYICVCLCVCAVWVGMERAACGFVYVFHV